MTGARMPRAEIAARIAGIAVPVLLSSLAGLVAPLLNAAVIGRHHPPDLYVLGLLLPVLLAQQGVNESLRVSSVAFSSQAAGSGDLAGLNRRLHALIALGAVLNLALALVFLAGHGLFTHAYDVPADRAGVAVAFIEVSVLAGTLVMASIMLMSSLYGLGNVRAVTVVTVAGLSANVAIAFTLVTVAGLGLYSLPLATTSTAVATFAWAARRLARLGVLRAPAGVRVHGLTAVWREIARISLPVCGSFVVLFVYGLLFTQTLAGFSPDDVAGFGIAYRIQNVVMLPAIAIGVALGINANRMVAAREPGNVPAFVSTALAASFGVFVVLGAATFVGRSELIAFMTDDSAIAASASEYLGYVAPAYILFGPLLTLLIFLEETGNGLRALAFNVGLVCAQLALVQGVAETAHSLSLVYQVLAFSYVAAGAYIVLEVARSRRLGGRVSVINAG